MDLSKYKVMEGDCRPVMVKSDFYRECGSFTNCKKIGALITAVNNMAVISLHFKGILCKYDFSLSYNIFVTYFVQGIPLSEIGDDGLPFTHKNGSHSQLQLKAFLDLLSVMRDQDRSRIRFVGLTDANLHDSDCVLIADALKKCLNWILEDQFSKIKALNISSHHPPKEPTP